MQSVDEVAGTIAWPETKPFSNVSKGYTYFEEGDVLFAKITPCMQNGKHAIAQAMANGFGFGTTEFHVVRPSDLVTSEWLHLFLRQPWVLDEATRHFRGAVGQQRVPKEFLSELPIPLPPLPEQKRIVAILNQQLAAVDRAKKAAEERLGAARALQKTLSSCVFNSPDARAWPEFPMEDLCTITAKQVNPTSQEYKSMPHVNGENIESATGRILYLKSSEELGMRSGKYVFQSGDVLYSKLRPYLRKAVTVNFDGLCSADMYPLTPVPTRVTQEFLCLALLSEDFTQYAIEESQRSRMPKLNRQQLMRWRQRLPAIEVQCNLIQQLNCQQEFAQQIESNSRMTIEQADLLPPQLLHRAFAGDL